jgi:hypothetical protein
MVVVAIQQVFQMKVQGEVVVQVLLEVQVVLELEVMEEQD